MADYKVTDTELTSVANAIRTKGGTQAQLEWPTGFADAVAAIPSGGSATLIEKSITQNGTYNASSDNADGYSKVRVNVSGGGGNWLDYENECAEDTDFIIEEAVVSATYTFLDLQTSASLNN